MLPPTHTHPQHFIPSTPPPLYFLSSTTPSPLLLSSSRPPLFLSSSLLLLASTSPPPPQLFLSFTPPTNFLPLPTIPLTPVRHRTYGSNEGVGTSWYPLWGYSKSVCSAFYKYHPSSSPLPPLFIPSSSPLIPAPPVSPIVTDLMKVTVLGGTRPGGCTCYEER